MKQKSLGGIVGLVLLTATVFVTTVIRADDGTYQPCSSQNDPNAGQGHAYCNCVRDACIASSTTQQQLNECDSDWCGCMSMYANVGIPCIPPG